MKTGGHHLYSFSQGKNFWGIPKLGTELYLIFYYTSFYDNAGEIGLFDRLLFDSFFAKSGLK